MSMQLSTCRAPVVTTLIPCAPSHKIRCGTALQIESERDTLSSSLHAFSNNFSKLNSIHIAPLLVPFFSSPLARHVCASVIFTCSFFVLWVLTRFTSKVHSSYLILLKVTFNPKLCIFMPCPRTLVPYLLMARTTPKLPPRTGAGPSTHWRAAKKC